LFPEAAPRYIAPVGRNVLVEWVVLEVVLVKKGSATLPRQSGHLPGLVLCKKIAERVASLLVLSGQQQLQVALALDEFVLFRRTPLKDAHQMLDPFLSRLYYLNNTNFIRNMADNGQALFVRFRCGSKVVIVGDDGLHLDEVHSLLLEG